jgi:hypothetical protein
MSHPLKLSYFSYISNSLSAEHLEKGKKERARKSDDEFSGSTTRKHKQQR